MKKSLFFLLISSVVIVSAQTIPMAIGDTFVIAPTTVQGTFTSPNVLIDPNASTIQIQLTGMPTADYTNTNNSLSLKIQSCLIGSPCAAEEDFIDVCMMNWVGGARVGKDGSVNPPAGVSCGIAGRNLTTVRARAVIPNLMTSGATFTLT